jgi:hypothetical protein
MREQAKAEQMLEQTELSISLLRAALDAAMGAGVDEAQVQQARSFEEELERERAGLLDKARRKGMRL